MPIFITGSTGFIGNKLAFKLAESGEIIHALCRASSDVRVLEHPNIKIFYGDVTDKESIMQAMSGCSQVYHLAAYAKSYAKDPSYYFKVNVDGTKYICESSLKFGVKKVVITSTVVTFGPTDKNENNEKIIRDDTVFYTTYEHSKFLAEKMVNTFIEKGLNVTTVNPTRVFGPGMLNESNSVTLMIQMYLKGKMRVLLGDGCGIGNYGYVDDIVQGHILAMEKGKIGEKYILGGENVSYNRLFEIISGITDKKFFQIKIPKKLAFIFANIESARAKYFNHYPLITPEWVETFSLDWIYSSKKAEAELGYVITPLSESLQETIKWLNRIDKRK